MSKGRIVRTSVGLALIALLAAGVPAEAKPKPGFWKKLVGALCTLGGVILEGTTDETKTAETLIGIQGVLTKTEAHIVVDPSPSPTFPDPKPSYAGENHPEFCGDGGVSCPAVQALLKLEVPAVKVPEGTSSEVAAFVNAANRVIEDGNLFGKHSREGASADVKEQDLRSMGRSLATAAEAFDRLNLPLELSQEDISGFQREILASGLPEIEQGFWVNSGLTPEEVAAIAQFLATSKLELGVSSVSMSRILHEEAAALLSNPTDPTDPTSPDTL